MGALKPDTRGILTTCSACGKTNRITHGALARPARCGHCKTALPPPDAPLAIPSAEVFDALIRDAALPVVVDFWAPWCAPCRMVAPELEKVAKAAAGSFLVVKVNTESLSALGERFAIRSIPTMAVFQGGREITRSAGARPAGEIEAFVRQALLQRAS